MLFDEPIDAYHAAPAISHSKVKYFRDNFALTYKQKFIDKILKPDAEKKHFVIGHAVECLLAYGEDKYAEQFVVHPATYLGKESQKKDAPMIDKPWNWNANACLDWAELNATRTILSPDEDTLIHRMRDAVMRNPDAAALIKAGTPQVTFRSRGRSVAVQCRSDWFGHEGTVLPSDGTATGPFDCDLKTIESLSPASFIGFDKQAADLGYHLAAVWYRWVIRRVLAEIGGCEEGSIPYVTRYFIVVDKKEWPSCTVYTLPGEMIEIAENVLLGTSEKRGLLPRLIECYESGSWSDAPIRSEVITAGFLKRDL